MSMLARNDLESARGEFERAVELRPLYPEALLNLGIVCFALEHYIESEEFLRRALAADPTFTEAHQYLQQITKLR
jgi:tetratricopeptide (TPR) repeat protein